MRKFNVFAILAAVGVLSACTASIPARPATLSFDRTDCPTTVDTLSAVSLVPEKDSSVWTVERPFSAAGPCVMRGDNAAPYMVFELPGESYAKMIEVGAALEYARVLSPKVVLLDAEGAETREFSRDQYMFRPGLLSVQFVPLPHERYALVTVDPEPIGQRQEGILASTSTTTYFTGYGASNWTSGQEIMFSRAYSYEGIVKVLVYRPDKQD